jgi:excinuclease ABC subunit A
MSIEDLSPKKNIIIKGAAVHNLKKIDVAIPRNNFVVVTGLSGSGKSSLAFDTLYAEGQRRYVESLSAYARQFIGRMDKPEVEYIKGISPAIAIEQKVNTRNPRSTVGTSTEIYDYLKLLYARIGRTFSPVSGERVHKDRTSDVVDHILTLPDKTKVWIYVTINTNGRKMEDQLGILLQNGFSRIKIDDEILKLSEVVDGKSDHLKKVKKSNDIKLMIDRLVVDRAVLDEISTRAADSVDTAFYEGHGECIIEFESPGEKNTVKQFSNRFELDGITFEEPSPLLFSFNNPYGACKRCEGFGSIIGIDEDLVVPDKSLSIYDGAIVCWRGEKMKKWNEALIKSAHKFDFPIHKPYYELNSYHRELLWKGNKHFNGLDDFFKHIEEQTYKIQYRVMLSRYRGKTMCPDCKGTRLRSDANYVKIAGRSITDIVLMPVSESLKFFRELKLDEHDRKIATRLLTEITNRLQYLNDVGLSYLTLNRLSNSLSGGESQRINLATSLGSSLVGSMYILDEPSIGLHSRDTKKLIDVLKSLQALGNTLIVVEHDEEIMRSSDQIIDIGPGAGTHGGELVFQGKIDELSGSNKSMTARYLTGDTVIEIPSSRRKWKNCIEIIGARENNLKNIDVKIPIGVITAVTGVSGSGKTSLVKKVLYPGLKKITGGYSDQSANYDRISGDYDLVSEVEFVDQNPIGKSSRSNPVTYVKAYDDIRTLFSDMPLARSRGYKSSHFSFNVDGGRCQNCQGEGFVTIEMQFMADIHLKCESCNGKRFKDEILAVEYKNKNIDDILNMTVSDALSFFDQNVKSKYTSTIKKVNQKLKPLEDVGLGYVRLGQASSTLSGGEAQRVKLASFLSKGKSEGSTFFIFDEPTTGLHFHDIHKLLHAFNMLVRQGHSVLIIEHNLDVIKCADWMIDLGPEAGDNGGELVYAGVPEGIVSEKRSVTGKYLNAKLN